MGLSKTIWSTPAEVIRTKQPLNPTLVFAPTVLQSSARRFLRGFPGRAAGFLDEVLLM